MASLREWIIRLWATLRPQRDDSDLEQELRLHLELAAEETLRSGHALDQARQAARIHAGLSCRTSRVRVPSNSPAGMTRRSHV